MKRLIVDFASSTFSAACIIGVLLLAAAPAKADSGDIIKGLMLGLIISELNKPNTPTTHQPQVTVLRDRPNCGHFENLDYQGAYVVWTKFNACTGQVVAQEVRPRF